MRGALMASSPGGCLSASLTSLPAWPERAMRVTSCAPATAAASLVHEDSGEPAVR